PDTWSIMELRTSRDRGVVDRIYADWPLLKQVAAHLGAEYVREFDMTNDARYLIARSRLEREGVIAESEDTRDPRARARLLAADFLPLYEGRSFWLHDPYFARGNKASITKFTSIGVAKERLGGDAWLKPRLVFRDITHASTNQRTLVAALMPPGTHGNK